jgi:hypothetical protein
MHGIIVAFSTQKDVEKAGERANDSIATTNWQELSKDSWKEMLVLLYPHGTCFEPSIEGNNTPIIAPKEHA